MTLTYLAEFEISALQMMFYNSTDMSDHLKRLSQMGKSETVAEEVASEQKCIQRKQRQFKKSKQRFTSVDSTLLVVISLH